MAKSNKGSARRRRRVNQTNVQASAPVTQTSKDSRGAGSTLLVLGMLSILVLAAYSNSLSSGFVFDDHPIIERNPAIRSVARIPSLFATGYWEKGGYETDPLYRPLVMVTYAFNYAISGLNPVIYHLTNILLHLAVCWSLYALGRLLGLSTIAAFGAAAIFSVHPLTSEAVVGVVGRAELMMALGVLVAVIFDIERNPLDRAATRVSWASTLAFCAALLSKEQAVMLPFLLLILSGMRCKAAGASWWNWAQHGKRRYLVWASVLGAYLLLRYSVLGGLLRSDIGFVENPLARADTVTRVMSAFKVAGYYLSLVFWPAHLSADYSYNAIPMVRSFADPGMLFGALSLLALCAMGIVSIRRSYIVPAFGISITLLFFLPVSNLVVAIGTIMGERLFYLPLAGLCLALGAGLEGIRARAHTGNPHWIGWAGIGATSILVVLLASRTVARNRDWENDFTLFQSAVAVNPAAAKPHLLLGAWLARQGRTADAIAEMEQAAAIYPNYRLRHTFAEEMGNMLLASGRADDALSLVKQALEAEPDHPALLNIYGQALQQREQWDEAIAMHERALEVTRQVGGENTVPFVNGLYHLARAYAFKGNYGEADAALEQAIEIMDSSLAGSVTAQDVARFVSFRAIAISARGDYRAAQPLFQRLVSIIAASETPQDFRSLVQPLGSYAAYLRETNREAAAAQAVERQLERISHSTDH